MHNCFIILILSRSMCYYSLINRVVVKAWSERGYSYRAFLGWEDKSLLHNPCGNLLLAVITPSHRVRNNTSTLFKPGGVLWLVCDHPRSHTHTHTLIPCTAAGPATAPRRGTAGYTSYRRTEPTLPSSPSEKRSVQLQTERISGAASFLAAR